MLQAAECRQLVAEVWPFLPATMADHFAASGFAVFR
jgi:hypothetical protein